MPPLAAPETAGDEPPETKSIGKGVVAVKGGFTMSIGSAKKFVLRILNDDAFKKKISSLSTEERVAFAKEDGFDFDANELLEARNQVLPLSDDAISDDVMESVAGGGHCGFTHESGEVNII